MPPNLPPATSIGKKLEIFRKRQGLTLADLATILEVKPQQVHNYETGTNRISACSIQKICTAYNISPLEFIEGPIQQPQISINDALQMLRTAVDSNNKSQHNFFL